MTEQPEYGWRGRIGLIVPPANTTVEPELAAMMPSGIALHSARLPGRVTNDTSVGLRERFEGYIKSLAATADSFGGASLSAMCLGVTGTSYLVGPEAEEGLLNDLRRGGAPHVMTAARAITELLRALGCRRIALVTPYPAWVVDLAKKYWLASGFEIVAINPLADVVSIYSVNTEKVVSATIELQGSGADAVVLSGTGVATLPAIEQLAPVAKIPMISSNLSLGWWILATLGINPTTETPSAALLSTGRWLANGSQERAS